MTTTTTAISESGIMTMAKTTPTDSPTATTTDRIISTDTTITVTGSTTPTDSIATSITAATLDSTTAATPDLNTNTDSTMTIFMFTVTSDAVSTSTQSPLSVTDTTSASTTTDTWSVASVKATTGSDINTVFDTDSVFSISTPMTGVRPTTYIIRTNDFPKGGTDSTTTRVGTGTTIFTTLSSSTVSTIDLYAFPDFSATAGLTADTAPSSRPALETGDTAPTVPGTSTPCAIFSTTSTSYTTTNCFTIPGRSTDCEVSISDTLTLSSDSTSSSDSTDSGISGTDTSNQITSTTLSAGGTTTSRGAPTTEAIPEIIQTSDGAPFGDTPSTGSAPNNQAGDSSFKAGTDTTFPDVPSDTVMNIAPSGVSPPDIPPSDVPLPDTPLEGPPPNIPPPDIPLPDVPAEVPSPDLSPPDEAQPDAPLPDVPSSNEAPPDIYPPNALPTDGPLSAIPFPDVPSEVSPPDVPPPDEAPPKVPPFDVPLPDIPPEVPQPDVLPSDVSPVDVLTPDILSPDVPPPDVPSPDAPSPDVPLPDFPPETPSSRTLIDEPSPDGSTDASVESLVPSSEQERGYAAPEKTLDRPDPAGDLAPVDFTFPFPDDLNSIEPGSDFGLVPVGDLGNIPDDSRVPVDVTGSNSIDSRLDSVSAGLDTEETGNGGMELTGADSSAPNTASQGSMPDSPQAVDDPGLDSSAAQIEGISSREDSTSGGPAGGPDSEENAGKQNQEKGTE